MIVRRVECFVVPPGWIFVRLETESGLTGWGEAGVQTRASAVRAAIGELGQLLIGRDARRIEDNWQLMSRAGFYALGPVFGAAVAALDIALWDLVARDLDVPVHALLGGAVRDRVPAYCWIGETQDPEPADLAMHAKQKIDEGYWGVKMTPHTMEPHPTLAAVRRIGDQARAVRAAIGDTGRFAIDLHGTCSPMSAAMVVDEVASTRPLFVEEPLRPEHSHQYAAFAARSAVPIACGERAFHRRDFVDIVGSGVSVAQPDVAIAHGISEARRIASLCDLYGVAMAPHCAVGPIALAATLHLAASLPNLMVMEQDADCFADQFADYVDDASVFVVDDGCIALPMTAGIGVQPSEARIRLADSEGHPHFTPPQLRHPDGSVADW